MEVLARVCKRLGLAAPSLGSHDVFSRKVSGIGIQLPGWHYKVVIDPTTGELSYDNYSGDWGRKEELDKFLQAYPIEAGMLEAENRGYQYAEEKLPTGEIRLRINVPEGQATTSAGGWR